ncbi:hypothetical protein L1049_013526 [Liquidambar formosana]|uniref:Uncharacterized protein n=1 Tax=Liquidambar formosana TaxID=63359 RepID=A0AAP0RNN4_LIQFO
MTSLNLTVNFFSTKYTKHSAGCPSLPEHMKVQVCPMDELPCYMEGDNCLYENEDDRDDDEECDETGSTDSSIKEGLTDNSTEYQNSIEGSGDMRESWDSPIVNKDHRQPCCLTNSPVRTLPSLAKSFSTKGAVEDRDTFGLIEDSNVELGQPTRKQLPTTVAGDKDQPPVSLAVSQDVEIIDVLTPSPDCRISLRRKKKRVSGVRSEIIDLTKSPVFVQL